MFGRRGSAALLGEKGECGRGASRRILGLIFPDKAAS